MEGDKTINKKVALKKYSKSNLIYNGKHSFYKCHIRKIISLSLRSKYFYSPEFYYHLNKLSK